MSNPVTPFRNNLFASRGIDIKSALDYVDELALASTEPAAVQTAARVLLNTIDGAVTQAMGPSAVEEALFAIIDKRIAVLQINTQVEINASIDDWMDNNLRDKMMDILANEDIDDDISNWMSNNFDINDYDVDSSIEVWMENNLQEKVEEAIGNVEFNVTVK